MKQRPIVLHGADMRSPCISNLLWYPSEYFPSGLSQQILSPRRFKGFGVLLFSENH
jgi:hypothetical protein